MDEEAVSPVIGVILMVAIVVVLAGVVFILVAGFKADSEGPPDYQFAADEQNDAVEVITGPSFTEWSTVQIRSDKEIRYAVNEDPTLSSPALTPDVAATLAATGQVAAGDEIRICGTDGGSGVERTNVQVRLFDVSLGFKIHESTFSTVAACA